MRVTGGLMLKIAENRQSFLKDGKPFFWLADTCWSAFTNITDEEWDIYLHIRKQQGFNVLQINILPQWDASYTDLHYSPKNNNSWYDLNDAYFEHARNMCLRAKEEGFELALVLLWCNYIPHTWASDRFETDLIPYDAIDNYVRKVHASFTDLEPVYIITGDTDFNTEQTVSYYVKGGTLLKELAPHCLYSAHLKGNYTDLPRGLIQLMDFCMYQSGHNPADADAPYRLALDLRQHHPDRPVINSEPCYEEMGHYGAGRYGRFTRRDVRRAVCTSILAGACAGVTYGAQGIYSWHKTHKKTRPGLGEAFDEPKPWQQAVMFEGAWDVSFLKNIMEGMQAGELKPRQDLLVNNTKEIRVAETPCGMLVYVPYNTNVKLRTSLAGRHVQAIGLAERYIAEMPVREEDGVSVIGLHPFHEDALLIIR